MIHNSAQVKVHLWTGPASRNAIDIDEINMERCLFFHRLVMIMTESQRKKRIKRDEKNWFKLKIIYALGLILQRPHSSSFCLLFLLFIASQKRLPFHPMMVSKWQNIFAEQKIEQTKERQRFIVHNAGEWNFIKSMFIVQPHMSKACKSLIKRKQSCIWQHIRGTLLLIFH